MSVHQNFIGREWHASSETCRNINPSDTDELVGEYSLADTLDSERAISAAAEAFPGWSKSGIQHRFDVLDTIGTEILARKVELGRLLAREEGKILPEAIGEAARAGQIFKFFAGEALRLTGEVAPSVRPGINVEITREPVGVVGIVTPWNFPIAIPAWKIAPALAFGNCVVFKPASLVPGTAWALADIISRSGLPKGRIQSHHGSRFHRRKRLAGRPQATTCRRLYLSTPTMTCGSIARKSSVRLRRS